MLTEFAVLSDVMADVRKLQIQNKKQPDAMATAEANALGLIADSTTNTDGTFIFSSSQSYTFNPNNQPVPGKYDLIEIPDDEISEIMR